MARLALVASALVYEPAFRSGLYDTAEAPTRDDPDHRPASSHGKLAPLAVQSRHLMDRVESKFIRGLGPEFAEVFVEREPSECLESSSEVVGFEEVGQVHFELFVGVVKVALDRSILDGSIHAIP
jgi:hypothetical protein